MQDVRHLIEECGHTETIINHLEDDLRTTLSRRSTKVAAELVSNTDAMRRGAILSAVLHLPHAEGQSTSRINDACAKKICRSLETLQQTLQSL